jgi:hypothetical protein
VIRVVCTDAANGAGESGESREVLGYEVRWRLPRCYAVLPLATNRLTSTSRYRIARFPIRRYFGPILSTRHFLRVAGWRPRAVLTWLVVSKVVSNCI